MVSPDFDPTFDDAGVYLAFATPNGIESELVFVKFARDPSRHRARERELLLFVEESLVGKHRPRIRRCPGLALEVRRLNRADIPVFSLGWCGAPSSALPLLLDGNEFIDKAVRDIRRRLGNYPRPKLHVPT